MTGFGVFQICLTIGTVDTVLPHGYTYPSQSCSPTGHQAAIKTVAWGQ